MHPSSLMNRLLGTAPWLLLAGVLGMLPGAPARADQPAPALQAIDVQPLAGQQLQLTLRLSGPAPQPLSFTIDNPARISFDLPNTTPLANLWNVGDGVKEYANGGTTACAETAKLVADQIAERFPASALS